LSSNQFNTELARLNLDYAEQSAIVAQKQYEAGSIDQLAFEKALARRDIAKAELNGDDVEVARIQLRIAEKEHSVAQKRFEVGATDSEEVARAKLAYDYAVIVLRQKRAESEK
jgi:outer membrane protein TolC